jgi:protein-tyrosine phosphatase
VPGAEVSLIWAFEASDEELTLASYGQRGSDLLVETPSMGTAVFDMMLCRLRERGFRIVLAHVERVPEFQRDPERLEALAEQGVLLQVNADAVLARPRGSPDARLGRRLCADGLIHVVASDGHGASEWRPITRLAEGAEAAASLVGPERARWMTEGSPAAILDGRELPEAPSLVTSRQRRRLRDLIPTHSR